MRDIKEFILEALSEFDEDMVEMTVGDMERDELEELTDNFTNADKVCELIIQHFEDDWDEVDPYMKRMLKKYKNPSPTLKKNMLKYIKTEIAC